MKLTRERLQVLRDIHTLEYVNLQNVAFLPEVNQNRHAAEWIRADYPNQAYHLPPANGAIGMQSTGKQAPTVLGNRNITNSGPGGVTNLPKTKENNLLRK
jgi:hypothetical protein